MTRHIKRGTEYASSAVMEYIRNGDRVVIPSYKFQEIAERQYRFELESGMKPGQCRIPEIALPKFVVNMDDLALYVSKMEHADITEDLYTVAVVDLKTTEIWWQGFSINNSIAEIRTRNWCPLIEKNLLMVFVYFFADLQQRLLYAKDDYAVEERKVKPLPKKKEKSSQRSTRKVRLYRTYTLVRETPLSFEKGKKHKITCPSWGVRGHYRHYKSGKIVFVAAYTKGKNRDTYSGKEYHILRKETENENRNTEH